MAFKQLQRIITRMGKGSFVSFSKNGQICFSKDCADKLLNGYNSVIFFYDEDRNLAGIKPVKNKVRDSYDLNTPNGEHRKYVTSITILRTIGQLPVKQPQKYNTLWDEVEKMIIIDLNNPII